MDSARTLGLALGLLAGVGLATVQGCDYEGTWIAGCPITCPKRGIAEGNAAISGIAETDSFFAAVLDVSTAARDASSSLRTELDAIAISLGLLPGSATADIRAALEDRIAEAVEGGLSIRASAPRCEAAIEVAIAAAIACDGSIEPGTASVACSGSCQISGGMMASCPTNSVLTCIGQAPDFQCQGDCQGTCELDLAASCEGTCRGICTGTCSVRDAQDNCAGACEGNCQGTCDLVVGGSCSGACTGSCTDQPDEGCQAHASARCEATADLAVSCASRCEGRLQPPAVAPECRASVEAKANAGLECTPPALDITWQWTDQAQIQTDLRGEFKAWLQGFRAHLAVMLAATAKAEILIASLDQLGGAGRAALESATGIVSEGDVIDSFKLTSCAIPQLEEAATVVGQATEALSLEVEAALEIFNAIGI